MHLSSSRRLRPWRRQETRKTGRCTSPPRGVCVRGGVRRRGRQDGAHILLLAASSIRGGIRRRGRQDDAPLLLLAASSIRGDVRRRGRRDGALPLLLAASSIRGDVRRRGRRDGALPLLLLAASCIRGGVIRTGETSRPRGVEHPWRHHKNRRDLSSSRRRASVEASGDEEDRMAHFPSFSSQRRASVEAS